MILPRTPKKVSGFTIIELLVVLALVAILAALVVPMFPEGDRSVLAGCKFNLKQIGLAQYMWSQDNTKDFPALVSTNNSGTKEYLESGRVDLHFQALTPYLSEQTRFLCCPADKCKSATNFSSLKNTNISYFVSLDATLPSNSASIAAGDSNLEINGRVNHSAVAILTAMSRVGWISGRHGNATNLIGNFLFSDGHVQHVPHNDLAQTTQQLGTNANRLAFP